MRRKTRSGWARPLSARHVELCVRGVLQPWHWSRRSAEDFAREDQRLDLGGPLVDLGDAHVAEEALDGELAHVAVAAVDLHGVDAGCVGDARGERLGYRGFLRAFDAAGQVGRRAIDGK